MSSSIQDSIVVGNASHQELTEDWFNARLSGDHKLALSIAKYLSTFSDEEDSAFSCKTSHTRVAPAAGVCGLTAFESPRFGNTGGRFPEDITDRINIHRHCDSQIEKSTKSIQYTKLDWLSVSFVAITDEQDQGVLFNQLTDFLSDYSIDIDVRDRGQHGYSNSANLVRRGDVSGDVNCGILAWSNRQGVFLELSGQGCEFTREGHPDLYRLITVNAGRISRNDVALDLDNNYCIEKGITVPKLDGMAYRGEFRSIHTPNGVKQAMKPEGDWSPFVHGDITPETYDPYKHCPAGLTSYVGSTKSDNQIAFYEKGKQLLGAVSDVDYLEAKMLIDTGRNRSRLVQLLNDNNIDLTYEGEKAWVRVERRFRRGSNKKWLAPDVLVSPDTAFIRDFPGLEKLLADYVEWLGGSGISTIEFSKRSADLRKSLLLSKKIIYGKKAYGSLVKTLKDMGRSAIEIVEMMSRATGLKEYVSDLSDAVITAKDIIKDSVVPRDGRCSYSPAEWYEG